MLLLIDNYDSFTYNLYQYFCELGAEVLVKRNDELQLADIERLAPQHLVISRPLYPERSGYLAGRHSSFRRQAADPRRVHGAPSAGAGVRRRGGARPRGDARQNLGDSSPGVGVFHGLSDPLTVTRYHSLVLKADTLPDCFEVTARSERDGVRDGSWASATALWRWKACSSIRKACSASRATSCWIISSSVNSAAFFRPSGVLRLRLIGFMHIS